MYCKVKAQIKIVVTDVKGERTERRQTVGEGHRLLRDIYLKQNEQSIKREK